VKKSTFLIFCLEGALLSFNVAATAALVPSIAKDFALSQFIVARIIWIYMLPYGIAALLYGPLVRVFDARRIELTCVFLFSCSNLLAWLSHNINMLFAARFLMGAFGASVIPLGIILIAEHFPADKRGKFIGLFFGATFCASLLGLFLSGIISWRMIYLIPAIAGFVLFVIMFFYLPSFKPQGSALSVNYLASLRNRKVLVVFTYIFIVSLLYHGIQQWLGVYFSRAFGLEQFAISMLITLSGLSSVFGEVLGGLLADFIGRVRTVNIGLILMALSALLLILKLPMILLVLLMIAWGFGWTFNHAGLSTMLADLPRDFLNEAASLNSSVRFIAGGIGVALAGWIMPRSFAFGFILFGICFLGLLVFDRALK
jgi:predicted MFS family arabinose efflux permease